MAEISKESFTVSVPAKSFKSWFRQKGRHLTTGKYYKLSARMRLGTEYFSRILFYVMAVILLLDENWKYMALGCYVILTITKLIVTKLCMRRLDEKDLLLPSLLFEPLMPFILGLISVVNTIRPQKPKWS